MTLQSPPPDRGLRLGERPLAALALVLCLGLPGGGLVAADRDRNQPANIEADRAEIGRETGVSRYFGNVVFVQGDLRITANRLVIRAPGGAVEHAEADGEPARLFSKTEKGEPLRARGRNMVYEPEKPLITLTGNAQVERGDDDFTAGWIQYAPDTGNIEAERDDEERVRITIQPDEEENGDGGDEGSEGATNE